MKTTTNKHFSRLAILFLLIASPGFAKHSPVPHKFYMSVTDMEYNEESKSLEIIIQFFTDDLEKALEQGRERVFLGTEKETEEVNLLIEKYLNRHFRLQRKNSPIPYTFLGKEASIDYTWVYLEVENFDATKDFVLENNLLTELFEEQSNQVNYLKDGLSRSITLHKDESTAVF
jgi:hypothetical protein